MIYLFKGSGCKGDEGGVRAWKCVWMHFSICGAGLESKLHENIKTSDEKNPPKKNRGIDPLFLAQV